MNSWKEFELAGLKRFGIPEHPLRAEAYLFGQKETGAFKLMRVT
jgi:hypothetical protein